VEIFVEKGLPALGLPAAPSQPPVPLLASQGDMSGWSQHPSRSEDALANHFLS